MNVYITIEQLKTYLAIDDTGDDNLLKQFCVKASRLFDGYCHRRFYPTVATYNFDYQDPFTLVLDEDLLAVTTLTTSNDSGSGSAITSAQYNLTRGGGHNRSPYTTIEIDQSTTANFSFYTTPRKSQQVIGTWGFHDDWSNAWIDSGDTVQDGSGINSSVTAVTVANPNGADVNGITPRLTPQQLIKVNSEYMHVVKISGAALTVKRGVNGSTAASHSNGDTISVYQPMWDVVAAMEVLASYQYRRRTGVGTDADRPLATSDGVLILPSRLPDEVKSLLKRYRRVI